MRHIFFLAIFFFGASYANAQLLWYEDFLGENDGDQTGIAAGTPGGTWSTTAASVSRQDVLIANEILVAENTGTEQRWETNTIDISSAGYAIISSDVWSALVDASDYLRLYYKIDGGPEVLFYELDGGNPFVDFEPATPASAIVSGSTLQVVARFRNNTRTILFWTFNSLYGIDNVTVTPADVLYSRKSGTWTDVAGGFGGTGTWSTNRSGTPACGCVPLNDIVAVIQNTHTVTLPISQTAEGPAGTPNLAPGAVDVESGGILQYNVNGVTLGIQQGLVRVRSGGAINSSSAAITGEQISFDADIGGASFQVDAGGSASLEDLVLGTEATNLHYLSGGGSLTITDDILLGADGGTLTNNRTASFTVADELSFNAANSAFVNNGILTVSDDVIASSNDFSLTNNLTLTISDDIILNASDGNIINNGTMDIADDLNFNGDNNTVTNNSDLDMGDIFVTDGNDDDNVVTNSSGAILEFADIDANNGELDVLNSGTITQSGNFIDIGTTDTNFDNLTNALWEWTLTPNSTYDTDIATVLNLTAAGNTFDYLAAGAQRIIPTTYHHINLSTSGAKDANNASFIVRGDWTVSGTATFTEGTGTITLDGASNTQTITNSAGETFYNLVIDNSFGASPQITLAGNVTVLNALTMTDGNVNLNANTFTIGSSAVSTGSLSHSGASGAGWMYGGNLARYMATAATTIGTGDQNEGFFPLGSASDWRPFYVGKSNTGSSGGRITVSHTNSTSTSDVNIPDTNPVATIRKRHNSFWTVSTSGISAGTWALRAGGSNFGTIANVGHLRMATSSGVVATNSAGTGTIADPRVNRTALTYLQLANNFHVASTDPTNSPLPIELLTFTAQLKNSVVELKWSTASETNNHYFTIERTTNAEQFDSLFIEDGMGTSKEINHYKVIDHSPLYGRSYYRLKQTDFDGKFSYSGVQVINYDGPEHATLSVSPNPFSGPTLTVRIEGLNGAREVPVQILNMQGQTVFERIIEVKTPGVITEEISADNFLPSGMYIIKAGSTLYLTQKIVVE